MRRLLILGATVIAIAGCGDDDPAPQSAAPASDATGEWVEQATAACERQAPRLEQRLAEVDRALLDEQGGPLPRTVRRYTTALTGLYDDLEELERPPDDGRVNQLMSQYGRIVDEASLAVENLERNRDLAVENIAAINGYGAKAHKLARELGAEVCTGWLVGA